MDAESGLQEEAKLVLSDLEIKSTVRSQEQLEGSANSCGNLGRRKSLGRKVLS